MAGQARAVASPWNDQYHHAGAGPAGKLAREANVTGTRLLMKTLDDIKTAPRVSTEYPFLLDQ
jgi:hypothetical protein